MRKYFCPDYYLHTYHDASAEFLMSIGVKYLILDIDNTLAPYEQPEPDDAIFAWFRSLDEAGIRAAFVSNNDAARVGLFNQNLGLPMYPKGGKPGRRSMRAAMEAIGASPDATAIMGDQVFTDVWAGKRVGIRTILVPPIKDKRDLGTRLKRVLEKPVMRYYRKREKKGGDGSR